MIHIDVRQTGEGFVVEASTDGAGFATQYVVAADSWKGGTMTFPLAREEAERTARVFANACEYAGADVRMTSGGHTLARV